MLMPKTHKTIASLVLGLACLATPPISQAASPVKLMGAIIGVVSDGGGIPQMGATVTLLNRQDRIFDHAITDEHGQFRFPGLLPNFYSIRVSLATFVPAFKKDILVQPGMRSVLNVNLSGLFSSIQLTYPPIENGNLMSDDWKWVLRSAASTRPVLRFAEPVPEAVSAKNEHASAFSQTRGMLKVSAGDGSMASSIGNEADLGTAFALATSLYGKSMLQVSGNVGYGSQTGAPTAAFRTSYSHSLAGGSPEVSLTMRQLYLPGRFAVAAGGNESALPMLRTMSASFDDRTEVGDHASFQYGFTMDSVSFLDHLNYFSPYARLTYDLGADGQLVFTYSSGNARPDLAGDAQDSDLQRDIATLGLFPRLSLLDGHAKVQRGDEYEVAYTRKIGSRTYGLSAYHEAITNAALNMVAPPGLYGNGDLLPDLFSGSSTFNAGNYSSSGYSASVTQDFGDHFSATLDYGSLGALTVAQRELVSNSPDELRSMIRAGRKHAATVRIAATSPWTGTRLIASYQITAEQGWAMPGNMYSTQSIRPIPGLNIFLRQPIPRIPLLPWRMEATADLRNLLAQGYLPLFMSNGQQATLVQTPRSFRGGLSFIF
jgi:Carboxypeptidase regulatory-like domain/TonB dependent receptor-like, beta-barrel